MQALGQVGGYVHDRRTFIIAVFLHVPLRRLAHGGERRRCTGAVGYRVALGFLRSLVYQLQPGVWRPVAAFGEGFNNGRLVGFFLFLNVNGDPFPQVWPVASFVLCPGHTFAIRTVERKVNMVKFEYMPICDITAWGKGTWPQWPHINRLSPAITTAITSLIQHSMSNRKSLTLDAPETHRPNCMKP